MSKDNSAVTRSLPTSPQRSTTSTTTNNATLAKEQSPPRASSNSVEVSSTNGTPDEHVHSLLVQRDLEGTIGYITGEFSCTFETVHGVLYVGSTALHFYGSYFLFGEKRLTVSWERIHRIHKSLTPGGIEIVLLPKQETTQPKSSSTHLPTSYLLEKVLPTPERAFLTLITAQNDFLMDRKGGHKHSSPGHSHRKRTFSSGTPFQRRNSDPSAIQALQSHYQWSSATTRDDEEKNAYSEKRRLFEGKDQTSSSPERTPTAILDQTSFSLDRNNECCEVEQQLGGTVQHSISCHYNNRVRGTLYAGQRNMYFYGKKFFWEKSTTLIPFELVRQIQLNERDQGIVIISKRGEVLRFTQMKDPYAAWVSLVTLQNNILTSNAGSSATPFHSVPSPRPIHRRMNSDPMHSATLQYEDLTADGTVSGDEEDAHTSPTWSSASNASASEQRGEVSENLGKGVIPASWKELIENGSAYSTVVVQDEELEISIEDFFSKFLADDAPFSIAKFLERRGDSNLKATSWEYECGSIDASQKSDSGNFQTRVITYTHPVNAPMAPPQADARKKQRLIKFPTAICVETKTFVDDVPMTDCFYVADRIRAEANSDNTRVFLTLEFEVTFVKSTFFQSIINKTASKEFAGFFNEMGLYMKSSLVVPVAGETRNIDRRKAVLAPPPVVSVTEMATPSYAGSPLTASPLLILILLVQVWLALEVRELRRAIVSTNEAQEIFHEL